MRKYVLVSLFVILVLVTISGCSLVPGGEVVPEAPATPLSLSTWPTPQPTPQPASPTPFPKITLQPTATAQPSATPEATPTALTAEGMGYSGSVEDLKQQVTSMSGFAPVAVGFVTAPSTPVRQGAGDNFGQVGLVEAGELAAILGTNAGGDWLYVLTISGTQGWVPTDALRVTGSLAEAPVLPNNPQAMAAPATTSGQTPSTAATVEQAISPAGLPAVAGAQVDNEALNMRQGPGAGYGLLGTLSQGDTVSILALNTTLDWALVKTSAGQVGWVSLAYLTVDGSLDQAPQIASAPPSADIPPGQLAPMSAAAPGSLPVASTTAAATGTGGVAPVATTSAAQPVLSIPALTPVATAKGSQPGAKLYKFPAADAGAVGDLTVDESVSVLGLNADKTWVLVKPLDKTPGWTQLSNLAVSGSLDGAPQVRTAWVESNDITVRSGPGLYYSETGSLAINDLVALLGVDNKATWALVKPILGGSAGWVPFQFINIYGRWDDVPQVPANALAPAGLAQASAPAISPPSGPPAGTLLVMLASGGDIMVVNADGSGLRRLTDGIDPVLSPDGQQVAFTRWEYGGESSALWTVNLDGSNERAILGEMRKAKGPDWSPDAARIILNYQKGGHLDPKRECKLLINLDTGERQMPNIPPNAYDPEVELRDGLPYLCWKIPADAFWNLRVVNVADGSYDAVYGGRYAFRPAWDPTSDWRIVVDSGYGLLEADANSPDAAESRSLTDVLGEGSPAFSPDGRFLATVVNQDGIRDIFRLNGDGSGRVRLTQTPLWVTAAGNEQPWNNVAPVWSPDGAYIAFLTDRTERWEVWVMNADGSNQHPLFSDGTNDQLPIKYDFNDERSLSWR